MANHNKEGACNSNHQHADMMTAIRHQIIWINLNNTFKQTLEEISTQNGPPKEN